MVRVIIIFFLFIAMGHVQPCFANISLSVNPVDGSNSLRFDKTPAVGGANKEEIHIRISSTNGNRYQVFQRILEPITNEKGEILNPQAIETETLSNSNASGTLYLQNPDHLSMSEQLLYSSAQGGQSDSFIIGYVINQNFINSGGSFRGRLSFSVRGMGNASSDEVTIDVFLQASSNLKISLKGAHNPNRILIQGTDVSLKTADYISVAFSGNSGQVVRIYQTVDTMPQNEADQIIAQGALQVDGEGQTDGLRLQGPTDLGNNRVLVYSSNKEEDSFNLYFLVDTNLVQKQEAGTYKGRVRYIVETDHGRQEFPIDIESIIPPVFTMNVTTPPGGVNFANVLPNGPPQDEEVVVTVLSNLHKPYQVLQDFQTKMTNQKGKEFDNKFFTVQVQLPSGQKGQTDFVDFSPIQTGEYPVFSSDPLGDGATFKVVYRLQGYNQMNAGNFLAPIRFSLNQK